MDDVIYLEECSMCTWNESIFGYFQMEWFKACVSLLIYCLDYLSIIVSGVLMPSTILLLLSISPFMIAISISSYIELHPYWVNIHLQFLYLLHGLIPLFLLFLINLFFYWRIIAVQNFVAFCQSSTWVSQRYRYIPSLLNLSSISLCIPPL